MKKSLSFIMVIAYFLVAGVPAGMSYAQEAKTGEGAVVGGLLGAVTGGIIGHQSHKATQGALIGGAVGALGGAMVGSQIKSDPTTTTTTTTVPAAKVTMKQVIYWSQQGLPGDEIIFRIRKSATVFTLTADDVEYLQRKGVSQRVIEAMQER